ncbi:MAG TPA: hypothetical protein VF746_13175 [Longimicrobium sp.]
MDAMTHHAYKAFLQAVSEEHGSDPPPMDGSSVIERLAWWMDRAPSHAGTPMAWLREFAADLRKWADLIEADVGSIAGGQET